MRLVILYRNANSLLEDQEERAAIEKSGFVLLNNFAQIQNDDLVIGRYSVWPFYNWIAEGIEELGGKLINSIHQHCYIKDLENYVADLQDLTFETWRYDESFRSAPEDCYVVKGESNSKKFAWNELMFAESKAAAYEIARKLQQDSLLASQKIFFRRYQKLRELIPARYNHPPVTEEYRFFVCHGQIVSGGFYWSAFLDELEEFNLSPENVPREFLQRAISLVGNKSYFYVLDVARTNDGNWVVVELNEGQMSGLSAIDPVSLYSNLFQIIKQNYPIV